MPELALLGWMNKTSVYIAVAAQWKSRGTDKSVSTTTARSEVMTRHLSGNGDEYTRPRRQQREKAYGSCVYPLGGESSELRRSCRPVYAAPSSTEESTEYGVIITVFGVMQVWKKIYDVAIVFYAIRVIISEIKNAVRRQVGQVWASPRECATGGGRALLQGERVVRVVKTCR